METEVIQEQVSSESQPISEEQMDSFFANGGELENVSDDTLQEEAGDQKSQESQRSEELEESEKETDAEINNEAESKANQSNEQRYKAMADEERIRRKELQKQIDQLKSESDNLKSTFQKIISKAQEQSERDQQAQEPNFEDDPLAALAYKNKKLESKLEGIERKQSEENLQKEMYVKQQQFVTQYKEATSEYANQNPEFDDAYNHLVNHRYKEAIAAGYTKEEARNLIIEEEAAIAARCFQQEKNPGEVLFELAKLRGYQGKNIQNETSKKIKENEQKIATLEKGLKASKSVNSSVGGGVGKTNMTLESIASMDDDEFDKVDWSKVVRMG